MTVDRTRVEAIIYEVLKEADLAFEDPLELTPKIARALETYGLLAHEKEPVEWYRTVDQEGHTLSESQYEEVCRYWQKNTPGENIVEQRWADKHSYEWRDEL